MNNNEERIAKVVFRGVSQATLYALVKEGAEQLGYTALLDSSSDPTSIVNIDLLAVGKKSGQTIKTGRVEGIFLLSNDIRLQVWCTTGLDWNQIGFFPRTLPFQVAEEIVRHLLRRIEGDEQAKAWEPIREMKKTAGTRELGWKSNPSIEIFVPLDVLDVAVFQRIEGYTARLAFAERREIIPGGQLDYILRWHELGVFGRVVIRKTANNSSLLSYQYAASTDKKLTCERKELLDLIIGAMCNAFVDDGIWEKHWENHELSDDHGELQATANNPTEKGNTLLPANIEQGKETPASDFKPWEKIPDFNWDRAAVKGLWEGQTDPEIAETLGIEAKTVTNRLSILRKQNRDSVPSRSELRSVKLG